MSTNCVKCIKNKRTGSDLLCDDCRKDMMNQTEKDQAWYFKELGSEQCLCERSKASGHSFCYRCYKALPRDMQRDLYRRIGDGYEAAFEAAVKYLEENVW